MIPLIRKLKIKSFTLAVSAFLILFLSPFIGAAIYEISEGKLITFGIDNLKDFYTVWIALFGSVAVAFGIYQTNKRISRQKKQLRDSRFSTGVDLLGNASESARTGGAYNLYFLACEFPEQYKESVVEILCAHIRTITSTPEYQQNFKDKPSNEIQTILNLLSHADENNINKLIIPSR
jgi:hypothetical protein